NYHWSPDGSEVLFIAREKGNEASSDLPYQPEVYEGNLKYRRAWVVNPEKGNAETFSIEGNIESAVWSHNGSHLLMSISSSPLVDDHYMEQQLHIVNRQSKSIVASIDHEGKMGQFCFSPDGSEIAFIAGSNKFDPVAGRLFIASASGGMPMAILPDWQGAFESIEWIDQDQMHYLGSKGAEAVLGTYEPASKKITEMIGNGLAISLFDVTPDGSMITVGDRWNHPPELFLNKKGSSTVRLTTSNPWLKEIVMGKQEVMRYKASDGLEIEGILIYPSDYDDANTYPLLVAVHGGPEAHINNGWLTGYSYPGQVAAAKGYAVFYPNYRGSTGRGLEYTLTSQGDPAGKEFDDIVDGVDALIEFGIADKDKVGVTGGSYGGYATAWLSTKYTDRFAGGVMFVGISDKVAKWGTTDIPNEEYLVHARKWVYEDYDFFLKRSPIYYAGQCKTPLLIMHGKEDPRVHPSQSMEMYRHVKSRTDTPVQLIFYPGEGHGNARATARYDYNLRMLQWFDTHVKGVDKS
ncbi:MAG: S9 family peptidase, partial [Gammaproteobacteria bacterium]